MASKPAPKKAPPAKTPQAKKPAAPKKAAGAAVSGTPLLTAAGKIDAYGEDAVIESITDGMSLNELARRLGVAIGTLLTWIAASPERSARAREARTYAARIWDEKAIEAIEAAQDPFELARAKEMAHHYRWRASKSAPKDYGEKTVTEHTGANGGAIEVHSTVTLVRAPVRAEDDE